MNRRGGLRLSGHIRMKHPEPSSQLKGSPRSVAIVLTALALLSGLGLLLSERLEAPPAELVNAELAQAAEPERVQEELPALSERERLSEGGAAKFAEVEEPQLVTTAQEPTLRGWVFSDVLGTPLSGAKVKITRRMHSEFWIPDAEERDSRQPVEVVLTDSQGRFEAKVPVAVPLDIEVSAREHATARRDHLFAGDDVELRLSAAATLEGVLTRESDSSPVEAAKVLVRDSRRVEQARVLTDMNGRFLFEDLEPGLITVEITPRDVASPPSQRIELLTGTRVWLDLALEAGVRIFGVVSDQSGGPIADAEVGLGASFQRSVKTNAEGRYELVGIGGAQRRDLGDIRVRAEGYGNERKRLGEFELAQDTQLDFELQPARRATGRVVDSAGAPIEGVYVAGVGSKSVEGVSRSDWESTLTGDDGRFALTNLHLLIDHQLFLRRDGYGARVYDFPADEGDRRHIDYGDLVLHPGGRIEGALLSQTGAPLADHLVKLRGANTDLDRFRPEAEPLKGTWVTSVRHSRTDTGGRFHFTDLPGGELRVTASVRGMPEANAEETVDLPEGGRVDDVRLTLDLGEPITGVVLTPEGLPATGVFVQVRGSEDQPRIRATTGAGGRFELLGVTEEMGAVELFTIVASYNWSNPDARLGASDTVGARAGDKDLVLGLRDLVLMTGRLESVEGEPVEGVKVMAYMQRSPQVPAARLASDMTDAGGTFSLELPEGCLVDLVSGTPKIEGATEEAEGVTPKPAALSSIASDAQGVVLRFEQ